MEKFIYEIRPYFFLTLGCVALYLATEYHGSAAKLMVISGGMLLFAAGIVVRDRLRYRGIIG